MNTSRRENFHKTVLAAIVGAFVALLVSPFTQSLSFLVNEYLARPILTIEYVEVVPEERPVSFPAREVQALLTSQGFRSGLMRGIGAEPGLMVFQGRKDTATPTEVQSLKGATERLLAAVERRTVDLGTFRKVLGSGPTEAQVREVAAKYRGPVMAMVPVEDVRSLKASLLATIETESAALAETVRLGKSVLKALGQAGDLPARKIKLKLSVLNRGSTDGLIRHVGELRVPRDNLTVKIRRSAPPTKSGDDSLFAMAVPVAVTNPAADTERATSVGKVEKNSMSEFWMEVDETATSKDAVLTFAGLATEDRLREVSITLLDHQNRKIERTVVLSGK
jgi:hypothetical protein